MTQPIRGTWFEFQHWPPEGKYWDDTLAAFTAGQWTTKVAEIAALGMEYLVLMGVAWDGRSFYPSAHAPLRELGCADPLETLLTAADQYGMKVFVSNGFFGPPHQPGNRDAHRLSMLAMEELLERYGDHMSFYGWYFPNEARIEPYYADAYVDEAALYTGRARELDADKKTLIAPFGTNWVKADDTFVRQLDAMRVDVIAYQDEVGVKRGTPETTPAFYEALRKAHDKVPGTALWADMEVFTFEGEVYKSALLPAPFARVERQLRGLSPHVDTILIYQYQGMMNEPGSTAFAGHPDSTRLYTAYREWLRKHHPEAVDG